MLIIVDETVQLFRVDCKDVVFRYRTTLVDRLLEALPQTVDRDRRLIGQTPCDESLERLNPRPSMVMVFGHDTLTVPQLQQEVTRSGQPDANLQRVPFRWLVVHVLAKQRCQFNLLLVCDPSVLSCLLLEARWCWESALSPLMLFCDEHVNVRCVEGETRKRGWSLFNKLRARDKIT